MKLKDMSRVELEVLSYTDLTYMILKENKKAMNTGVIFKEICDLLGYSEDDFANKIGDYYTSLTLDKRFVLLESAEWDLREKHSVEIEYDEEEETEEDTEEEEIIEEDEEENVDAINEDDDLEDDDEDALNLTIETEDELEEM